MILPSVSALAAASTFTPSTIAANGTSLARNSTATGVSQAPSVFATSQPTVDSQAPSFVQIKASNSQGSEFSYADERDSPQEKWQFGEGSIGEQTYVVIGGICMAIVGGELVALSLLARA